MCSEKVDYLKVVVPWVVEVPRKTMAPKRYSINLNTYRNLKGIVNNNVKVAFKDSIKDQVEGKVLITPVKVRVSIFKPTKRRLDKGNIYSVASKYLYDALTELGVWEDDNDDYVKDELLLPSKLDPDKLGKIVFEFKTIK